MWRGRRLEERKERGWRRWAGLRASVEVNWTKVQGREVSQGWGAVGPQQQVTEGHVSGEREGRMKCATKI